MTSLPPNTTWFTLFLSFYLKLLASLSSHVVLGLQRDIATSQYDVVHAFSLFLPQNARFILEPRRVGPPTRHRYLPIRRGSRFFSPFASNYSLPTRATSHWTPNATSHTSNTTWRLLSTQKTTRTTRVVLPILLSQLKCPIEFKACLIQAIFR